MPATERRPQKDGWKRKGGQETNKRHKSAKNVERRAQENHHRLARKDKTAKETGRRVKVMVVFGHSPEPKRSRSPAAQAGPAEGDAMAFRNEEVAYLLIVKWTIYQLTSTAGKSTKTEKLLDRLGPIEKVSSEMFESLELEGIFVLASSVDLPVKQILPVYYTRQQVERTFDICKNYTDLPPLRVESEETFRGPQWLTFIGAYIVRRIQNTLLQSEKKSSSRLSPTSLFQNLGYQHCSVHKDKVVIYEADSEENRGYKTFKLSSTAEIKI